MDFYVNDFVKTLEIYYLMKSEIFLLKVLMEVWFYFKNIVNFLLALSIGISLVIQDSHSTNDPLPALQKITLDTTKTWISSGNSPGGAVSDGCSATEQELNPLWGVELDEFYYVITIELTRRNNDRFREAYALVFHNKIDIGLTVNFSSLNEEYICFYFSGHPDSLLEKVTFPCAGKYGKIGKFVGIVLNQAAGQLEICHVSIYGILPTNVILDDPTKAWQTSVYMWHGIIWSAGIIIQYGSCLDTDRGYLVGTNLNSSEPAWAVDLERSYKIDHVITTTRKDVDWKSRWFHDAYIFVHDEKPNINDIDFSRNYCSYYRGPALHKLYYVVFPCNSYGRFLVVALKHEINVYLEICELEIRTAFSRNVSFILTDRSTEEIIEPNRKVFSGEFIKCFSKQDTIYFSKWQLSQICGSNTYKVDCTASKDCTLKLKMFGKGKVACRLRCDYVIKPEYKVHITNKGLKVTTVDVPVTIESGGRVNCLTYKNENYYFYQQLVSSYSEAVRVCKVRNRELAAIKDVKNQLDWLVEGADIFRKNTVWYISKTQPIINCGGNCCFIQNRGIHWNTGPCNKNAFIVCVKKNSKCDPDQEMDKRFSPQVCYPIKGKGYVFIPVNVDFYEAKMICKTRNMILPKIMNQYVLNQLRKISNEVHVNNFWWMNAQKDFGGKIYRHYDDKSEVSFLPLYDEKQSKLIFKRCNVFGQHFMNKWGAYECYDFANVICQHMSPDCVPRPKPLPFWTTARVTKAILLGSVGLVLLCVLIFVIYIGRKYVPKNTEQKQGVGQGVEDKPAAGQLGMLYQATTSS